MALKRIKLYPFAFWIISSLPSSPPWSYQPVRISQDTINIASRNSEIDRANIRKIDAITSLGSNLRAQRPSSWQVSLPPIRYTTIRWISKRYFNHLIYPGYIYIYIHTCILYLSSGYNRSYDQNPDIMRHWAIRMVILPFASNIFIVHPWKFNLSAQ